MTRFRTALLGTVCCAVLVIVPATASSASASAAAKATTRRISRSGTASFTGTTAGAIAAFETPGLPGQESPEVTDRSHSGGDGSAVGPVSQPRPVTTSTPGLVASFDGLNHFQNRFGSTAGNNQFS